MTTAPSPSACSETPPREALAGTPCSVILRPDKRIQAWRPLIPGQRVQIVGKWKHRHHGTIIERLDNDISGMGRYAVCIDCLPHPADMCRHELKALTVRDGRNKKRAMDDSVALSPNAD